jgi:hypothetical protein
MRAFLKGSLSRPRDSFRRGNDAVSPWKRQSEGLLFSKFETRPRVERASERRGEVIQITDREKRADSDREAKKSGADRYTLQIVAAADFD